LYCPNCHAEFRPGFTVCSDCDVALVEALDGAATEMEEEGLSTGLEPFHETHSSDELAAILESLEENEIPYVVQAGTALSLLTPSATGAGELPEEWQARILVPGGSLKTARELLRRLHEAARSAAAASLRGLT
jgi:hypothetical protein